MGILKKFMNLFSNRFLVKTSNLKLTASKSPL